MLVGDDNTYVIDISFSAESSSLMLMKCEKSAFISSAETATHTYTTEDGGEKGESEGAGVGQKMNRFPFLRHQNSSARVKATQQRRS